MNLIKKLIKVTRQKYNMTRMSALELPLRKVTDRDSTVEVKQKIPPIVYQTWVNDLFGKTHASEIEKFRNLNPELSFKLYNSEKSNQYMKDYWGNHPIYNIYCLLKFGPAKADIFRYCILYERGGYYFDISKGCDFPLTKLHPSSSTALISFEMNDCVVLPNKNIVNWFAHPTKYILQWGFGFEKEHLILKSVIDNICAYSDIFKDKIFENPKNAILMFTGPGMFTKSLRDIIADGIRCEITQAGIDFNGYGVFEMKGSEVRYLTVPAYGNVLNSKIMD